MPKSRLPSLALVALTLLGILALPSCGGGAHYVVEGGGGPVFLLTNLHPDARRTIYSVNYTAPPGGQVLPMCTPVRIDRVAPREIRFTDLQSNRRYRYIVHRSSRAPVEQHVQRYFGSACADISAMTPEDQSGIQQGQIYQGMTKQGVILAVGFPPEHRTPSLDGDVWRYWRNKVNSFEVYFTNGVVTGIRN
ncbi:MAG: hypothetical protein H6721_20540 [Sandaracinus sp.]|nr:hypothetical protein [Sandaracinus sp.]